LQNIVLGTVTRTVASAQDMNSSAKVEVRI